MKNAIFILIGSLAVAGAYQLSTRDAENIITNIQPPTAVEREEPLKQIPVSQEPMVPPNQTSEISDVPVMVKTPVQPMEERGDAMLSEIDMLGGTPFDQSITMPFD